jgi:hypothetical protein
LSVVDRALLVLPRAPVRDLLREWLCEEGFLVAEVPAWEAGRRMAEGEADILVTSSELDGEWAWSEDPSLSVLVLAARPGPLSGGPRAPRRPRHA